MPASGAIKLLDANVWLALAYSDHALHSKAAAWFDVQADSSCAFCRVTQLALLRHLTNRKIMGGAVQTQQQAWQSYDNLLNDPRVVFWPEPGGLESEFRKLTLATSPSHEVWTDAYLAAFAITSGIQIVTFDQGFKRFANLALELLAP